MSNEKLKPCPECGKFPLATSEESFLGDRKSAYYYECYNHNCIIQPKVVGYTREEAMDVWNKLTPFERI